MWPTATRRLAISSTSSRHPLVAIVGATGTGKSQLAVSLAEHFDGEIINGDALQMYEGLPITTNKIPFRDRKGIQHHLLGCVKLEEGPWTVAQFIDRASKMIEEIRSRGRLPILVGGTHYYTQSLLFGTAVGSDDLERTTHNPQDQTWPVLDATTEELLEELRRVDPAMAVRWHPKDRRKIRRSLEIYLTTGKKASAIYQQQREEQDSRRFDGSQYDEGPSDVLNRTDQRSVTKIQPPFRYDTLIFWTHASSDVLNQRLEKRVDGMVSEGLLEEVKSMYSFLQTQELQGNTIDQSRGIWVAIGFKELLPYVKDESKLGDLGREGIERTKIATRQYARRQIRWIKLRLQRAVKAIATSDSMFLVDATNLSQWSENVEAKALDITADFLSGRALPRPDSLSEAAREMLVTTEEETKYARLCEACEKTMMSEQEWVNHLKSKGHKSAVRPKLDWRALYSTDKHG